MSSINDLEIEIITENISHFEWMNIENLLISIQSCDLVLLNDVSMEKLEIILAHLVGTGVIEEKFEGKEKFYRRSQISERKKKWKFFK